MRDPDFYLDGISAAAMGIRLQEPISFSAAVPRVENIKIVGKSGDLHIYEGAFDNRPAEARCFALSENAAQKMEDVCSFLFGTYDLGYRKLQTYDDTGRYWEACIVNAGEIATRAELLNPFTIRFDCKPFCRIISGDEAITPTSGDIITNPSKFNSLPLLYITASETGYITISGTGINILSATNGEIIIDCEECRAYTYNGTSADSNIQCSDFPVFYPGENRVYFSSGISARIIPRWRTLI